MVRASHQLEIVPATMLEEPEQSGWKDEIQVTWDEVDEVWVGHLAVVSLNNS
jgi:hypothetical protein